MRQAIARVEKGLVFLFVPRLLHSRPSAKVYFIDLEFYISQ